MEKFEVGLERLQDGGWSDESMELVVRENVGYTTFVY